MKAAGVGPWANLGIITVEIALWIYLSVTPYGWQRKLTSWFLLDSGLYKATVSAGPVTKLGVKLIRKALKGTEAAKTLEKVWVGDGVGTFTLAELQSFFCTRGPLIQLNAMSTFCPGFGQLHLGSMVMLFAIGFASASFLVGAGFHYYYWFVRPQAKHYKYMISSLFGAPLFLTVGLVAYGILTMEVETMDPHGVYGYSYSFFAAVALGLCAYIPVCVQLCFLGRHPEQVGLKDEHDTELAVGQVPYGSVYEGVPAAPTPPWEQHPPHAAPPGGGLGGEYSPSMPPPGPAATDQGTAAWTEAEAGTMPELRARTLGELS
mmetsp:Transcript_23557/g.54851  ORF Transcript_23557/g.54851 Transcript_23557/m.54851 type:complete len:319 (-) Transcript_23557:12-968(-)